MKYDFDEMTGWQNDNWLKWKAEKWQADQMTGWRNDQPIDEITLRWKWPVDEITGRWNY